MRLFRRKPQYRQEYVLERGTTRDSRLPVSLSGVRWDQAPKPPRNHQCWPQTKYIGRARTVRYCACGAWSVDGATWVGKNRRRRSSRRT